MAEYDGVSLHLSERSSTGGAWNASASWARLGGTHIGTFDTAVEAAVAARYAANPRHPSEPGSGVLEVYDGVRLHLSARNPTGYLGVSKVFNGSRQWTGTFGATYAKQYLGTYDTAVEAAAAYARHMQSHGMPVEAEAVEEEEEPAPPAALGRAERFAPAAMSQEVVAEHDGVALHLSAKNPTGYLGIQREGARFKAVHGGNHIGVYATPLEAAGCPPPRRRVVARRPGRAERFAPAAIQGVWRSMMVCRST